MRTYLTSFSPFSRRNLSIWATAGTVAIVAATVVQASSTPARPPTPFGATFRSVTAAASTTVRVGDFFFRRAKVQVKRGSTVHWTWIGMASHNVTFPTLHRHSHTQTTGTYQVRFTKPGTYHYLCTVHGFTGTVVVE